VRHPAEEWVTRAIPGGALLLLATVLALLFANTPLADAYFAVRDAHLGLELGPLSLDLSIGHWASDGLLAVFFFLAGLELKQELVVGDLRSPAKALVPIAAAFGGVAVPALLYTLVNLAGPSRARAAAGRSPPRPTSPSPSRSSRCWAPRCPPRCAPSC
jgi:NhaA family Na+:H+ antiporter